MFRLRALLILALCLAGCGRDNDRDAFTDSRTPPSLSAADWPPRGWAWGLIQVGSEPPQRYGVAAPDAVPRAQVLILPGYGESAEDYYGLANRLIARGIIVWSLDGAGQGGSARRLSPRDIGHLESFDGDLAAMDDMTRRVMRPDDPLPLILVAAPTSASLVIRRLQMGAPAVTGAVLIAPTRDAPRRPGARLPSAERLSWSRRLGFSYLRAPGQDGWLREGPEFGGGLSQTVSHAWRLANPDLRMGAPSLGWYGAFGQLQQTIDQKGLGSITTQTLILNPASQTRTQSAARDRLCRALPRCIQAVANNPDAIDARISELIEALRVQTIVTPPSHALSKAAPGG
ncbi:MAG: alpha/beta hydrolase [Caulobacteraceae bacterium]|nr:alpha/beta hydrolase [Caulobacteraceae bacterium]